MSFVQNINGKFEKITEASWYKILMPKLYGWGAAVVILGALFKIEEILTNISGIDVPRATKVIPITTSLIPNLDPS